MISSAARPLAPIAQISLPRTGGRKPESARSNTIRFASLNRWSRFITIRSAGVRKPHWRASSALALTLARAIISNTCCIKGSGSALGVRLTTGEMTRRTSSLQPPAAGINPTPASTWPMYASDAAQTADAPIVTSAPPPSTIPNGALITGLGL